MDLGLELGEGGGIVGELGGPAGLLVGEVGVDLGQGLLGGGHGRTGLGGGAEAHANSFRIKLLLPIYNSSSDRRRNHFSGMDPGAAGRWLLRYNPIGLRAE